MTPQFRTGRGAAVLAAALAAVVLPSGIASYAVEKPSTHAAATPTRADEPGDWTGDGLHLNAADNKKVDAYLVRARRAERTISPQVRAAARISDAELVAFDHRLKSPDSLKRKVATDLKEHPQQRVEDALAHLNDAVRYTFQWPDGDYTRGVTIASDTLALWGNANTKWTNTWGRELGYKGLNTGWREPRLGQKYEVQFHTPSSKHAQEVTHKLYEELRLPTTTARRKAELQREQQEIFASVPVPEGAAGLAPPAGAPEAGDGALQDAA
ncbi:ATP nucleotide 3'-pyrophosphokinase [Streptomyces sp. NPDC087300]|uniref:ATP nucleotide 3'-pyrophosphokinase n=1 Tax=Streptomyces sp. NPDC087300 TaxID=3365780 RepID=UPI0037F95FC4